MKGCLFVMLVQLCAVYICYSGFVIAPYSNMVGMPIDLIISDYTLSVEMKIIEGVAILSLNVSKLI